MIFRLLTDNACAARKTTPKFFLLYYLTYCPLKNVFNKQVSLHFQLRLIHSSYLKCRYSGNTCLYSGCFQRHRRLQHQVNIGASTARRHLNASMIRTELTDLPSLSKQAELHTTVQASYRLNFLQYKLPIELPVIQASHYRSSSLLREHLLLSELPTHFYVPSDLALAFPNVASRRVVEISATNPKARAEKFSALPLGVRFQDCSLLSGRNS